MKFTCRLGLVVGLLFCISIPPAMASVGIFLIGYGAKSRGMGGVGIALHEDSLASAINPAGISFVEDRVDGGILVFNPKRNVACCLAPDGINSDKAWFFLPNVGITHKLDDKYTLGLSMVGYAGGRTYYDQNLFDAADTGPLGANLEIGLFSASLAYKVDANQSVAASLLLAGARFVADGLGPFKNFSKFPNEVTNNNHDWAMGGGLRLGWQGHYMDDTLSFGAVYQTKIFMTEFDDYRGLFPDAGTLELPATFSLGSAFKPTPELTIAFDWVHVFYESVRALGNRSLPITTLANDPNLMGQKGGPGFGWENQDVFKIGLQYDLNPEWTIRGGVAYGKNPIKKGGGEFEFNVLAPVVTELHLTAGGTYKYGAKHEISFAIMHAFNNSETEFVGAVDLPFINQDITLEMEQWTWDFGYGYKF